eukprot:TRINITY_DN5581_c0_g2_i1.p1 TRINITY_DN5581_c0_g2~~TRINITY_DN5581_c0_g2_i1.p1  ORF type:complete len:348 (-),score=63.71 TRINITY_DN5581_c0_g2_i1:23-1066(-)
MSEMDEAVFHVRFSQPSELSQDQLQRGIVVIKKFIEKLSSDKEDLWASVGIDLRRPNKKEIVRNNLDSAHWQITMYYKYCKPSQLGKVVPHIKWVIENNRANKHVKLDTNPLYTLGVALMKSEKGSEQETREEARKVFDYAFSNMAPEDAGLRSAMWGRAYYSRLLHDLGDTKEAKKQERMLAQMYERNKIQITPSDFAQVVTDEGANPNDNPILKAIQNFGHGIIELPGTGLGANVKNGMIVQGEDGKPGLMVMNFDRPQWRMPVGMQKIISNCNNCGSDNPKNKCSRCGLYKYCSRDRQTKHWKEQREFCNADASIKEEGEKRQKEEKEKQKKETAEKPPSEERK